MRFRFASRRKVQLAAVGGALALAIALALVSSVRTADAPRRSGERACVRLADGTELEGRLGAISDGVLHLVDPSGRERLVPEDAVREVRFVERVAGAAGAGSSARTGARPEGAPPTSRDSAAPLERVALDLVERCRLPLDERDAAGAVLARLRAGLSPVPPLALPPGCMEPLLRAARDRVSRSAAIRLLAAGRRSGLGPELDAALAGGGRTSAERSAALLARWLAGEPVDAADLVRLLVRERAVDLRISLALALGLSSDRLRALPALVDLLSDSHPQVCAAGAIAAFLVCGEGETTEATARLLARPEGADARTVCEVAGVARTKASRDVVLLFLRRSIERPPREGDERDLDAALRALETIAGGAPDPGAGRASGSARERAVVALSHLEQAAAHASALEAEATRERELAAAEAAREKTRAEASAKARAEEEEAERRSEAARRKRDQEEAAARERARADEAAREKAKVEEAAREKAKADEEARQEEEAARSATLERAAAAFLEKNASGARSFKRTALFEEVVARHPRTRTAERAAAVLAERTQAKDEEETLADLEASLRGTALPSEAARRFARNDAPAGGALLAFSRGANLLVLAGGSGRPDGTGASLVCRGRPSLAIGGEAPAGVAGAALVSDGELSTALGARRGQVGLGGTTFEGEAVDGQGERRGALPSAGDLARLSSEVEALARAWPDASPDERRIAVSDLAGRLRPRAGVIAVLSAKGELALVIGADGTKEQPDGTSVAVAGHVANQLVIVPGRAARGGAAGKAYGPKGALVLGER